MARRTSSTMQWRSQLTVAAVLALLVTGCGVSDTDGGGGSGSLGSMLGQLADTPENRSFIAWVDIAAAREAAGVAPPEAGSDSDVEEYLRLFVGGDDTGVQPQPPGFMGNQFAEVDGWRTEVGFTLVDIDQSIDAGVPPDMTAVARGRIKAEDVEEAVASDPGWKDALETVEHGDVSYSRWLDDGEIDVERVTPARPLGNSLRLQAEDGRVLWARTDDAMEDTIDAGAGDTDTLADVEDLGTIAEALEGEDVYQAMLTADPGPFSIDRVPRLTPEQRKRVEADALEPWTAIGVGDAVDSEQPLAVLVLTHADDEAAEANVEGLRNLLESGRSLNGEPYADTYEVRSVERDGSTVTLVVEQELPRRLLTETIEQRSLVIHS